MWQEGQDTLLMPSAMFDVPPRNKMAAVAVDVNVGVVVIFTT